MIKISLKSLIPIIVLSVALLAFTTVKTLAVEKTLSDDPISIFTSDTCEFCEELETELKKTYESSTYRLKNIDTSEANKQAYQIALVSCGKEKGTVPMFLYEGVCVSGKEQILEAFVNLKSAGEVTDVSEADTEKTEIITEALTDIGDQKITDELAWYDYAIAGVLLITFIVGTYLLIKNRGSQNKQAKLISSLVFFISMAGLAAFLFVKVNTLNNLSSTGADAGKNAKNCLDTNSCKDWNEYVKAKAQDAENRGDSQEKKEWEAREVDQKILDAQINATNNALIAALKKNPEQFCGSGAKTCTYGQFLTIKQANAETAAAAKAVCNSESSTYSATDCKKEEANIYLQDLYGEDKHSALGGAVADIVEQYKKDKLTEAYTAFKEAYFKMSADEMALVRKYAEAECVEAGKTQSECDAMGATKLLDTYKDQLEDIFFKFVSTDGYTKMGIYVPNTAIWTPTSSDECEVGTSGGACPTGTATCICQETPTYRATCAAIGQSCYDVCIATHNVCVKDCSKTPLVEIPPETPSSETAVCQESCSSTVPCTDGTTCSGGKCINVSCPTEADCLCNSETPICGDGIINSSPQAPEQCELGNPPGTSCDWNSCDQNSCKCPDTNPNWDIEKASSLVCVNNNTTSAYAKVDFKISATYINEDAPTEVGVLERVVDKPQNFLTGWLDKASISNGGTSTENGGVVGEISWDLTGALSQFTIPSGQTQVSKDDFLTYTFIIPQTYFGNYVNLVTGYPNQENDNNSFSYTNSIYVACSTPGTALVDNGIAKVIVGIFLVITGLMFAYSQRGDGLLIKILNSDSYHKVALIFANKEERLELKKEMFENRVLRKRKGKE